MNENPPRKEKRPPREEQIAAAVSRLSDGAFNYSDSEVWNKIDDEVKEITTVSYRGIDLPDFTFEIPWVEMRGIATDQQCFGAQIFI